MRISMEEAMSKDLLQVALHCKPCQSLFVQPQCLNFCCFVNFQTRAVLHGQYPLGCTIPVYFRDLQPILVCEVLAKLVGIPSFLFIVNLLIQDPRTFIIDSHPISGSSISLGVHLLKPLCKHANILQIDVEQTLQAGSLHLDHNLLVANPRLVDLTQRSCGYGNRVKVSELLRYFAPKVFFNYLHGGLRAKWRHIVLQFLQFDEVLFGE
mmetsp:Transcript_10767/g.66441  ORF Transcript_10767/g.66441 Transcript_10767/m.66441 type:complete len:209 (-) Transcript_10767:703-1329(-)